MTTVIDRLVHNAEHRADRKAIIFDDLELTWSELADRSLRLSTFLKQKGVAKGDHVVLLCGNRPAFLIWFYAILNRGAVAVMVNTGLVGDGLRYSIEKSAAKTLIVEQSLLDEKQADIRALLEARTLVTFSTETAVAGMAAELPRDTLLSAAASDACTIIYTSGTTGHPKAVLNCHTAYLACGQATAALLEIGEDDRFMVFMPLFHTNPQMYGAMSSLVSGCALVIRPKFSATRFFDDARQFGATVFSYVGTVLAILANRVPGVQRDHKLRACIGGGAPLPVWEAIEDRFGVRVHELYGMTETGGWATGNSREARRRGSCGLPRADMEVIVADAEDRVVAPGVVGELLVRPKQPFVMLLGYFGDPSAAWGSAANFWFHTGDSGSIDADGFIYFHGRTKEIIRRGGENISPSEIEAVLMQNPLIDDAAVVGVPDPIFGEEIKAAIVSNGSLTPHEVREFLKGKVAEFMLPRYVQFLRSIPKTETHKIQRGILKTMVDGQVDLKAG